MLDPAKRYRTRRGDLVVALKRQPHEHPLFNRAGGDPVPWRATLTDGKGARFVEHYSDAGTWSANEIQRSELDLVEWR